MGFALDAATTLRPLAKGRYLCPSGAVFWNMENAFSGWTLAVAIAAVQSDPEARGELISINATYPSAIGEDEVFIRVDLAVHRPWTDFWKVSIFQDESEAELLFSADIVMGVRRTSAVELAHYEQKSVGGAIFTSDQRPAIRCWIRETDGRPLDVKGLAALSNTLIPRTYFFANAPRSSSTVSYSMYVFSPSRPTLKQWAAIMFCWMAIAIVCATGSYNERTRIWPRSGRLLAVTSQIAFFK